MDFSCNDNKKQVENINEVKNKEKLTSKTNQKFKPKTKTKSKKEFNQKRAQCPKSSVKIQELMKQLCPVGIAEYHLKNCTVECRNYHECEPVRMMTCPETYLPVFKDEDCLWTCQKLSRLRLL